MKAKHFQRADDPVRAIAMKGRASIARDIRDALVQLGESVDRHGHVQAGRFAAMVDAVDWHHFREILRKPLTRLADVHSEAAALGVRQINGKFGQGRKPVLFHKDASKSFNYDRLNPKTTQKLRAYQDGLIAALEKQARDTIQQAVNMAIAQGLDSSEIVDFIREVISLTPSQAQAVLNYRLMLEDLDPAALQRRLADPGDLAMLREAIDAGEDLDAALVDIMVGNYEQNYLDYRAATIADTETVRAANLGLHDVYDQAVERGAIPAEAVTRHWKIALDEKTCPICRSIPEMNPDGVGLDDDFDSEDGPQTDPPVHPSCRCSIEYVTDLDQVGG